MFKILRMHHVGMIGLGWVGLGMAYVDSSPTPSAVVCCEAARTKTHEHASSRPSLSSSYGLVSLASNDGKMGIPTDKLSCHQNRREQQPVVLVSCGSFNPPTVAHMRVLELVRDEYMRRGIDVYGAYMSPVHDAYGKESLISGEHRLAMCHLASESSDFIMTDPWEVSQDGYTRTLYVLESIDRRLKQAFRADEGQMVEIPRTVLVCGGDVVESMAKPDVWDQELLEKLLCDHGVACVVRSGVCIENVLDKQGTLLHKYRDAVVVVENGDEALQGVSSTGVRGQVRRGESPTDGVVHPAVVKYIKDNGLYT